MGTRVREAWPEEPLERRLPVLGSVEETTPRKVDFHWDLLTEKQKAANDLLNGPQRHTLFYGGSRSGKSALFIRAIIQRALQAPGSRHLVLRYNANAVWPSIGLQTMPFVLTRFFPWLRLDAHKSLHYYPFPNGSEIWLGGLVGGSKMGEEKVLGKDYVTIFLNECSQIPYASVAGVVMSRLAQTIGGMRQRLYCDLNPTGKGHWTNVLFLKHRDPISNLPVDEDQYASMQMNPVDNKEHLDPEYIASIEKMPLRQRKRFFEGEYVEELENALWTLDTLERTRVDRKDLPQLVRIIVAVDPSGAGDPLDMTHDAIGIVVMGVGADGEGYVLDDQTILAGPEKWGRAAVAAFHHWKADRIVAEINFGGAMVEHVIRSIDASVPFKVVTASRGKVQRAEPVAALYTSEKIHHVGRFRELEEEMCDFTDLGYVGEKSPNRADALVWAATELMLGASAQGWVEFYSRMAQGRGVVPTRAAAEAQAAQAGKIAMRCPQPFQNFAPGRGKHYAADQHGLIADVDKEDVPAMIKSGCALV